MVKTKKTKQMTPKYWVEYRVRGTEKASSRAYSSFDRAMTLYQEEVRRIKRSRKAGMVELYQRTEGSAIRLSMTRISAKTE